MTDLKRIKCHLDVVEHFKELPFIISASKNQQLNN